MPSGRGSEPVLAASSSSTSSTPVGGEAPASRRRDPARSSSRPLEADLEAGVRHRERVQLAGHGRRRAGRRPRRAAGELAGLGREHARAARSRSARSSAIRSSEPSSANSRWAETRHHSITSSSVSPYFRVSAVSAARRSETAARRAGSVSSAGGVRRHVGRDVGEQVADLGHPVGELPPPRGRARARSPGRAARRPPRRARPGRRVVGGQRLAGGLGGGAQRVGEPEPGLLGGERVVLARPGCDRLDLLEPEPEQVGLAGPLARGAEHLAQLGLDGAQPREALAVALERRRRAGPGEGVQRVALRLGSQQPVLVGLTVHGDQRRRRRGRARRPGTEAPPRNARERPSAETWRPSSSRPASTSPPCSSAIALERRRRRGPRPRRGPRWRRCAPRRCRRDRPAAARAP